MRKLLIAAAAVAAVAGSAGTALAVSGGSSPTVYSGCIAGKNRALVNVRKATSVKCAKGEIEISWNQAGPKGATGARGPQGPAGPPGKAQPVMVVAEFTLIGRDDSGSAGNWAKDDITRTVTLIRQGAVPVSDCSDTATVCYFYTETIADTGTFITDSGAETPNQDCTEPDGQVCKGLVIAGTLSGSLSGGGNQEFYADKAFPKAPKTLSYTGNAPTDTTDWYKLFFPAGTIFGLASGSSAGEPWTSWSWSYSAPTTCETWTDAYNNGAGDGTFAADGNIAGLNQCK
jgi:hypothetical protein